MEHEYLLPGVALWLSDVVRLRRPVPLDELRRRWPWFRPPQSYRFVRARVRHEEAGVVELAPRAASPVQGNRWLILDRQELDVRVSDLVPDPEVLTRYTPDVCTPSAERDGGVHRPWNHVSLDE